MFYEPESGSGVWGSQRILRLGSILDCRGFSSLFQGVLVDLGHR